MNERELQEDKDSNFYYFSLTADPKVGLGLDINLRYGQRSSSFSNNQFNELLWDSTFSSFTGSHIHRFSTFYLLGLEVIRNPSVS